MGNQPSAPYRRLNRIIPPVKAMALNEEGSAYVDKGFKAFENDDDRDQFIHAVIAIASNNGKLKLEDHDFRLLFARRDGDEDRIVARIVAIKNGIIEAKIEPAMDGEDQPSAFRALRKDVEVKLDRLLSQIPDRESGAEAGPSRIRRRSRTQPADEPPAYGSADVDMMGKVR